MSLDVTPTEIEGVLILTPRRFGDHRGWFSEVYKHSAFREAGVTAAFIQDNHAFSAAPGTLRGLHFQAPPTAQAKLLRVAAGAIIDVAVDIRKGSPTYGRHVAVELNAEHGRQLFVPAGFAHGYRTLLPDTHVLYKVDNPYSPADEGGLAFDDPALGIDWTAGGRLGGQGMGDGDGTPPIVSDRDREWPALAALDTPFRL